MIDAKATAEYIVRALANANEDDTLILLDNLENGEFAYIDGEDDSIFLVTVAKAKLVSVEQVVEL